jgi:NDP-sugar pyrophosphorylase family protein
MTIETAVVLAGGAGLRMRPLTDDRPKIMVEIADRPLLDWILAWLKENQVRRVVIGVAYKSESIIKYLNKHPLGLEIEYSEHTVEGGTAEGFRLAVERHVKDSVFFGINGDELTNVRLQELGDFHNSSRKATATITVSPLPSPFGVVDLSGSDVIAFREKPTIQSIYVSVGVYVFRHEILDYLPAVGNIERTTFPRLAGEGKLRAYRHQGFWKTVNTIKDLGEVEKELRKVGSPLWPLGK